MSKEITVNCPIHHIKLSYVFFSKRGQFNRFEDLGYCSECNKIFKIIVKDYKMLKWEDGVIHK